MLQKCNENVTQMIYLHENSAYMLKKTEVQGFAKQNLILTIRNSYDIKNLETNIGIGGVKNGNL